MQHKLTLAMGVLASLAFTGCIDDKYDLSDIDSTVRIDVNDLVVPINIDEATLRSILNPDKSSSVKIFTDADGKEYFGIEETGDINSEEINVDPVTAKPPKIHNPNPTTQLEVKSVTGETITYDINSNESDFSMVSDDVTSSIISIEKVNGRLELTATMTFSRTDGASFSATRLAINDLKAQLPVGLIPADSNADYNPVTGIYNAPHLEGSGNSIVFKFIANGLDFTTIEGVTGVNPFNAADRKIYYDGKLQLISGELQATGLSSATAIRLNTGYVCSSFTAEKFTGNIDYKIKSVSVDDVDLDNLPKFLSQDGTNVTLVNPSIFLRVYNPLQFYNPTASEYGIYAMSDMVIKSTHSDGNTDSWPMDAPFYVGRDTHSQSGYYDYALAPEPDKVNVPADYNDPKATPVVYTDLGKIFSGSGIPTHLSIDLPGACAPDQHVTDFRLGHDYGKVTGNYTFHAPLQFAVGSQIVYEDTMDGWNDDDLDNLTIESLTVEAYVETDIPVDMEITVYPVDAQKNPLCKAVSFVVPANAGQQQNFTFEGPIRHLDGLHYEAYVVSENDLEVLEPAMSIKFSKVRPRVTGYYQKEL